MTSSAGISYVLDLVNFMTVDSVQLSYIDEIPLCTQLGYIEHTHLRCEYAMQGRFLLL